MARKKNGGFGKVLEFIGLVDDGDARDNYVDEYSYDNYGRQQSYTPQRNRVQERPRQDISRRYSSSGYEPTRAPRMNRSSSVGGRFDSTRSSSANTRKSGAYVEQTGNRTRYDYSPRTSRFGSLDGGSDAYAAENVSVRPQRDGTASRQKTVMFTLRSLEECCDVIDNLILDNTVILTFDNPDVKLMQRAVDTVSGAVFALRGTIRKASEYTYLIAPHSVEVNETYESERDF